MPLLLLLLQKVDPVNKLSGALKYQQTERVRGETFGRVFLWARKLDKSVNEPQVFDGPSCSQNQVARTGCIGVHLRCADELPSHHAPSLFFALEVKLALPFAGAQLEFGQKGLSQDLAREFHVAAMTGLQEIFSQEFLVNHLNLVFSQGGGGRVEGGGVVFTGAGRGRGQVQEQQAGNKSGFHALVGITPRRIWQSVGGKTCRLFRQSIGFLIER